MRGGAVARCWEGIAIIAVLLLTSAAAAQPTDASPVATPEPASPPAPAPTPIEAAPPAPSPAEVAPAPAVAPAPVASPAPIPEPEVQEVVVRAKKDPPPATLQRNDIRRMPGAMGDPLRAVEVLPGVTPTVSGLPFFYVRGAPPNTTAFVLDDLPLPYLFHVGLGPSIVHPAFVQKVAIEPAGGHPRYGRAAGAFVTATTENPADELHGEARVRIIDASAFGEAPFAAGKGHASVGGTVSYVAPLLGVFAPELTIDYRDTAARVRYDVTPDDHLQIFVIGSYDFASQRDRGEEQVLFASEIYRLDLKWTHDLPRHGEARVGATLGYDRSRLVGRRFARDQSVGARANVRQPVTTEIDVEAGLDARLDAYGADLPSVYSLTPADYEETVRVFGDHTDTVSGAYAALRYRPALGARDTPKRPLDFEGGLRSDVYTSAGVVSPVVEPRVRVSWAATDRVKLMTSHGLAHQTPAYLVPMPAVAIPGLRGGLQEALQSSVTAEVSTWYGIVADCTLFRGVFSNLSDFVLVQSDFPLKSDRGLRGAANGLELSLRRPLRGRFGMQVSYTFSRSTREPERGSTRLGSYDRTHVLNVAALFDLGKGWSAGLRALTYTGLLRDPASGSEERLPAFSRLDARVEKRWKWSGRRYFAVVAEALNATASRETVALRCDDQGCAPRNIGPLTMPSLGVEGGF